MFDMRDYANSLLNRMAAAQSAPNIKREPCPHCCGLGCSPAPIDIRTGAPADTKCAWCAGKGYVLTESIEVTP